MSFQLQPMGQAGVANRMREIQAKLDSRFPRKQPVDASGEPFHPQTMYGAIGKPTAPMNPFGPTTEVETGGAPADLRVKIHLAAQNAGIDPALYEALIGQESSYNPNSVSGKGALGLAQLMPETAKSLGVTDPMDPDSNLRAGAKYLSQLLTQFGKTDLALAAYNAGPGAVKRAGGIPPYAETQDYVRKILARYNALRQP